MMMAADVGSLVRILNSSSSSRYNNNNNNNNSNNKEEEEEEENGEEGKRELVTRDLLGGCGILGGGKELDLDLKAPLGWEKRLDLLSGEVFFRRSSTSSSSSSKTAAAAVHFQDLNMAMAPHPPPRPPNLDLKLFFPSSYESVCTLDKVRSALERAAKTKQQHLVRPREPDGSSSSPTSSSTTTSTTATASLKQQQHEKKKKKQGRSGEEEEDHQQGESRRNVMMMMMATGCPNCLSYVLISKGNPRCPRCDAPLSLPPVSSNSKRPRIDLNLNNTCA